jgi:hypothetical protein
MKYKDFEEFLMEEHSKQYRGLDDDMPDDYTNWLENLGIDGIIEYGNIFASKIALQALKEIKI